MMGKKQCGLAKQLTITRLSILTFWLRMGHLFFLEKGIFYPASTSNWIYMVIDIGNLAPQTTHSKIRSYKDFNLGPWGTTQVTATIRIHAFSWLRMGHTRYYYLVSSIYFHVCPLPFCTVCLWSLFPLLLQDEEKTEECDIFVSPYSS